MTILTNIDSNKCTYSEILFQISEKQKELLIVLIKEGKAYLVKPLDQTLFAAAMDAVLQELNSKHFTIEYDGVTISLETSDIYFLESRGHKVLIHCKEQDLTLRMSIPEALEQLPKRCFVHWESSQTTLS